MSFYDKRSCCDSLTGARDKRDQQPSAHESMQHSDTQQQRIASRNGQSSKKRDTNDNVICEKRARNSKARP